MCIVYIEREDVRAAKLTLTNLQIPAIKKKIKNKQNPCIAEKLIEIASISARNL
jgi:hypothetical protein